MVVRPSANARHCSSGSTHCGETERSRSGSVANTARLLSSGAMPPNQSTGATACTPGTFSICGIRRIGSGSVTETRAWTSSAVTPTKLMSASSSTFTACSSPNSRNAQVTESRVSAVRALRRSRLATTKRVLVTRAMYSLRFGRSGYHRPSLRRRYGAWKNSPTSRPSSR
jgi:hypothetical protein